MMSVVTFSAEISRNRRIEPRLHAPVEDRPYYDVELDVPHSPAHMVMVTDLASIFRVLGEELGLGTTSDNAVWFLDVQDDEQRVSYPDLALLSPGTDVERVTAEDARLVGEVVGTNDRRKEIKDTRLQVALCEYNEVPELLLFFPELDDARALVAYRRTEAGRYEELVVGPGGAFESHAVPGLGFRVLPRSGWKPGRKVDVLFEGEVRNALPEERKRAEDERKRAEDARKRAEDARKRADELTAALSAAEAREAALRARLDALGADPEGPEESG